jgi:Transposase zinc-ribbon domain
MLPQGDRIARGFDQEALIMRAEPVPSFADSSEPRDPQSTEDAMSLFSDPDYSLKYLVYRRWPEGQIECPQCGGTNVAWLAGRKIWECRNRHPQAQFSVRSGTFMEDSRISLGRWLMALWLIAERNSAISSYEIARRIGITQKSAWLMMKRIRRAVDLAGISLDQFARQVSTGRI